MFALELELANPYYLMRGLTLALFGFWTIRGYYRSIRLVRRWTVIGAKLGVSGAFIRRTVIHFVLRVTILDPISLILLLAAVAIWTGRVGF